MSCLRNLALLGLCVMFGAGSLQAQSLVHLWAFDGNFNDTSGSGNHGTADGAPTFVSGRFGQGVSIVSPNDGVQLAFGANNLPLLGTDSWSMNVWANLSTAPEDLEYLAGFGLNDGFVGSLDTGGARSFITFGGEAPGNNFYFWGGARDLHSGLEYDADSQWHMYTITYNGTAMQMYKDAVPVFGSPVGVALNDALDEIHVGNPSNWNSDFDGSLDEFAIFNGALSDGQVGGLFFNNDINQPVTLDPSFTVNRDTNEIVLTNDSSFAIDVLGYTIRSTSGSLNPMDWDTIAGRFDAPPGGDGTIDNNDDWTVLTNTSLSYSIELSEGVPGTDGGTIGIGKVVNFGPSWVANPTEDVVIDLLLDDGQGTIKTLVADFTGNVGEAFGIGDLDTDGDVDPDDWNLFRTATAHDLTGTTVAEAYLGGDLDGDFDKDLNDFRRFVNAFDADNGAGAFAQMVAVPEPMSVVLFGLSAIVWGAMRTRRRTIGYYWAMVVCALIVTPAPAALWGYYPLNDSGNEATGNNINLNAVGDATFDGSVHPGLGYAGAFDGAGDAFIGGGFNKFVTNDITVVAWAYAESVDGNWNTIVKNWGTTVGGQFHLGLGNVAANTLQNHLVGNGPVTATTDFPVGEWVHTAFVVDSAALQQRLYMNGELVATAAYSGTLGPGTATGLGIGHKPNDDGSGLDTGGGPGPWNGRIDDVGLFNEALTAAQILQIYQDGLNGIQLDGTTTPHVVLQVDRSDGTVMLKNAFAEAVSINAYEISSPSGSLQPANWQDVAGNSGFPTGNGTGNGWEKDLSSDEYQLLETYLTGNSDVTANTEISLGMSVFGGAEDLEFRYRTPNGAIIDSVVEYIGVSAALTGDYNNDGTVNAADYTVWRDNLNRSVALPNEDLSVTPGQVTTADYGVWKANFGDNGSGAGTATVPEPAACWLLALATFSTLALRSFRTED